MQSVLCSVLGPYCVVYAVDIRIFGINAEQHERDLAARSCIYLANETILYRQIHHYLHNVHTLEIKPLSKIIGKHGIKVDIGDTTHVLPSYSEIATPLIVTKGRHQPFTMAELTALSR